MKIVRANLAGKPSISVLGLTPVVDSRGASFAADPAKSTAGLVALTYADASDVSIASIRKALNQIAQLDVDNVIGQTI